MMPGMNPRQMARMMAQMGIKTEEIKAREVVIRKEEGETVIRNPQILMMEMQGQKTFQISGAVEEKTAEFSEDDVKLVMEQAKCSREKAERALKETGGDIAAAIMKLQ